MSTDYRALLLELAQVLAEEYGVEREFSSGGPLLGNGAIELLARVRAALAQPEPVGPTLIPCDETTPMRTVEYDGRSYLVPEQPE